MPEPLGQNSDLLGLQAGTGGGHGTPRALEVPDVWNKMLFLLCWFFFCRYLCVRGRSSYLSFCQVFIKVVCQSLHRGTPMLLGQAGNWRFRVDIWEAGRQPVWIMARLPSVIPLD